MIHQITEGGSVFRIDNFPWDKTGARPETSVTVAHDKGGFHLHFLSYEKNLRAVETSHNSAVHKDSCMEAFIQFAPLSDVRYINFEANPNGAMYCAVRSCREDAVLIDTQVIDTFKISTSVFTDRWELDFYVPVEFIREHFPLYEHKKGAPLRANFYKCGDETDHEHYGCFNRIDLPAPDFHCPAFFADLVLA